MKRTERIRWEDESRNFAKLGKANSQKITPGRIIQRIYDSNTEETKIKDNSLTEFLVPEPHLSLKLYFDNVRNFGIVGLLGALAGWILKGGGGALSDIPRFLLAVSAFSMYLLAAALLLLNTMQAFVLYSEARISLRKIRLTYSTVYAPASAFGVAIVALHVLWTWALETIARLLLSTLLLSVILGSILISLYTILNGK